MPKTYNHRGGPYNEIVCVKLNKEARASLDGMRGKESISKFVRDLIRAEATRRRKSEPQDQLRMP